MRAGPIFFSDFWSDLFLSPACPRDVFEPKPEGHKVTGSKPVSADMIYFFFDFPVPGVVRTKV